VVEPKSLKNPKVVSIAPLPALKFFRILMQGGGREVPGFKIYLYKHTTPFGVGKSYHNDDTLEDLGD
jgi:hypothetical protein